MAKASKPAKSGTTSDAEKGPTSSPKSKRGTKSDQEFSTIEESWPEMREETRLLSDIHPYPQNPRYHPPAQIAFLAAILTKYGPDQRIVIDAEDDMILKGHGRRLAAIAAGLRQFPVVVRYGLSEAEKKSMRIADNQSALMSDWDPELIRSEVAFLKTTDYDVSLLGFGDAQLVQFMTVPGPPDAFKQFGDDIETKYCCPNCHFAWSGDPQAGTNPDEASKAKKSATSPKKKKK